MYRDTHIQGAVLCPPACAAYPYMYACMCAADMCEIDGYVHRYTHTNIYIPGAALRRPHVQHTQTCVK